jgi:hypothetical protein
MSFAVQMALASQIIGSVMVLMTAYMLQMKWTARSAGMESSGAVWIKLFNGAFSTVHDIWYWNKSEYDHEW